MIIDTEFVSDVFFAHLFARAQEAGLCTISVLPDDPTIREFTALRVYTPTGYIEIFPESRRNAVLKEKKP